MNEDTIVKTLPLPNGRDWEFYLDANVLVLAPHLCPEGRERALDEVQNQWRRSALRLVPNADRLRTTRPLPVCLPHSG